LNPSSPRAPRTFHSKKTVRLRSIGSNHVDYSGFLLKKRKFPDVAIGSDREKPQIAKCKL
jgi:hypothetical protein